MYARPPKRNQCLLTSNLFDTLKSVFQCVERAGVALGLALVGQPQLELLDGLHELFLGLHPGRLVAAAARGGGWVVLGAGGQQAVCQRTAGGREALGVGAVKEDLAEAKGKNPPHPGTFLVYFINTSCCSPWSQASCLSLCRWTSCGSCAWTRARAPLSPCRPRSPSRRSRSH